MKLKTLFIGAALAASCSLANANLVSNGDFSAGGANWTLTGNSGFNSYPGHWRNGAVGSYGYISQDVATVTGNSYTFSFDVLNSNSGNLVAYFDGVQVGSYSNISGSYTFNVTALDSLSTIMFGSRNDPSFNRLDNVSLVGTNNVPEPGLLALLAIGLVGVGFSRQARKV